VVSKVIKTYKLDRPMKKLMIVAVAALLTSGAAFAQDDMKKDAKAEHKHMKKEAKMMKKEAKSAGDDAKADAAKDMKKEAKAMKKKDS